MLSRPGTSRYCKTIQETSNGVSGILQKFEDENAEDSVRGDPDGDWTVLRALVTGAVQHRHEASHAPYTQTSDARPPRSRNGIVDCASVETRDRQDDSHLADSREYLSRPWSRVELLLSRGHQAHTRNHTQGAPLGQWPQPGCSKTHSLARRDGPDRSCREVA